MYNACQLVRGQSWRSGTRCDCKTDWLWVRSPLEEIKYLLKFILAALSSATQHAMPPEFGRKWRTECLNTRFPLPTLLCAGYSVKLIYFYLFFYLCLLILYFENRRKLVIHHSSLYFPLNSRLPLTQSFYNRKAILIIYLYIFLIFLKIY